MGIENGFYQLLNAEVATRTRTGYNTHEEDVRLQYGGTSMYSFDLVASQLMDSRVDGYVLGRWKFTRW